MAERDQLYGRIAALDSKHSRIAYAQPSAKAARLRGVPTDVIARIHQQLGFDATFIKADGARLRWLKAPGEKEPVVPEATDLLIPVLSVRVIGKPLGEDIVHHAEAAAQIMGISVGEKIAAPHLARLIADERGAIKNAGSARIVPVLNMAEGREEVHLGTLVAEQALQLSDRFDRVVISSMVRSQPIMRIVDR